MFCFGKPLSQVSRKPYVLSTVGFFLLEALGYPQTIDSIDYITEIENSSHEQYNVGQSVSHNPIMQRSQHSCWVSAIWSVRQEYCLFKYYCLRKFAFIYSDKEVHNLMKAYKSNRSCWNVWWCTIIRVEPMVKSRSRWDYRTLLVNGMWYISTLHYCVYRLWESLASDQLIGKVLCSGLSSSRSSSTPLSPQHTIVKLLT